MKRGNERLLFWRSVFFLYFVLLLYLLFFSEAFGRTERYPEMQYNLTPFQEIRRYLFGAGVNSRLFWVNIVGNVVAFVPFGYLLPKIFRRPRGILFVTAMTYLCSLSVELMQLISLVGIFDLDDIILNTAGGVLGCLVYIIEHAGGRGERDL